MRYIVQLTGTQVKYGDDADIFQFQLWESSSNTRTVEDSIVDLTGSVVTVDIANGSGFVGRFVTTTIPEKGIVNIDMSNEVIATLPADTYYFQVEVVNGTRKKIFPTDGGDIIKIFKSLTETQGELVPRTTIDDVLNKVDEKIAEYTKTIAKGDKGDTGPAGTTAYSLAPRKSTFTDLAVVAKSPKDYAGVWNATASDNIQNGPYGTIDTTVMIEVQPSTWTDAGIIRITGLNSRRTVYTGIISGGAISKWISSDVDLSQISVGGRNLILNSQLLTIKTTANAYATVEIVPYDSKTNMWHITAPQGGSINAGLYFSQSGNVVAPIAYGKKWVFSFDVKGTGVYSQNGIEWSENYNGPAGQVYSDWTRISSTGTSKGDVKAVTMYFNTSNSPLDVYIKLPKLEVGNVPTDWTPAPEDADNAYVKDTRLASGITDFDSVIGKTWSGKWYKIGGHWSNEPTGTSQYLQFEYTPGDNDKSGILEIRDWINNRYWIRSVSVGKWGDWVEVANDANVVHKTGNETVAGDKSFTGKLSVNNLNVSGDTPNTVLTYNSGFSGGASYYFVRDKTVHMFLINVLGFTAGSQRPFEIPSSLRASIPGSTYFVGMYGTSTALVGFNGTQVYISTSSVPYNANTPLNAHLTWQLP